jgi:hypothetical protein
MASPQDRTERLFRDIQYLEKLDSLRGRARRLRDNGLRALAHFSREDENWDPDISPNERVLFRRGKHLAWSQGVLDQCRAKDAAFSPNLRRGSHPRHFTDEEQIITEVEPYPEWPQIRLPSIFPSSELKAQSVDLFNMPDEPAPILFAANYLTAWLGSLEGHLNEGSLLCYYRILRELYNLHDTNWALGAARPGERSGPASVFVTTECARALEYFARTMENTSEFLLQMYEAKGYIEHVRRGAGNGDIGIPPLDSAWCATEHEWCDASIRTSIESFRGYLAIQLPQVPEVLPVDRTIALVEDSVRDFVEKSRESFCTVTASLNKMRIREQERFKEWRRRQRRETGAPALEQMPEIDMTETAHKVALGALSGARQEFNRIRRISKNAEVLREASYLFAELATWMRVHLAPVKEYFEKNLHRCLVEYRRGKRAEIIQDLAFSALGIGLITKEWDSHDCRQALRVLCKSIDPQGMFPVGRAFALTNEYGRNVINAQFIRAFSQIAQHSAIRLKPKLAERLIRYFELQAKSHEHGVAWPSARSSEKRRSSLWISAISVLALHRVTLMLNEHINTTVKMHFRSKSPGELRHEERVPPLYRLMCSDVGYASLRTGPTYRSDRVVVVLERMRAHLIGAGRSIMTAEKHPLCSLILYGPPGTGKTTLVKALAVVSKVDLIQITPADLSHSGWEFVDKRAAAVMRALSMLTSTLILFDEFDVFYSREGQTGAPASIMEMLAGNMLPRLDALNNAARRNRIAYVLTTNYVERFEAAAIRDGRFDERKFIYYPDAVSRICRLVSELRLLKARLLKSGCSWKPAQGAELRLLEVAAMTSRCSIARLCKKGWFSAPDEINTRVARSSQELSVERKFTAETAGQLSPIWRYIIWNERAEALGWPLSGSMEPRKRIDGLELGPRSLVDQEGIAMEQEAIINLVRYWDDKLVELFGSGPQLSWEEATEFLLRDCRSTTNRLVATSNSNM